MAERISTLLFPFINLTIFVVLLIFILKKPIKKFLKSRHDSVVGTIEEAKKIFEEADARASVVRQKMANIDKQGEDYIASMQADALYLAKRFITEAEQKAAMTAKDVNLMIEAEETQKVRSFKSNMISKIIGKAREEMSLNLKSEDSERFLKDIK